MGQIVYADLLFLINFSMDFLCFFVTARLLRRPFRLLRCIMAAAMGGIYSVIILFIKLNTVFGLFADLGFCILMCLCAYGIKDKKLTEFLLHVAVYFGVSIGTGGCMTAMYSILNRSDLPLSEVENNPDKISVWVFGLLAIISGAMAAFGGNFFKSISSDTISTVEITYKGVKLAVRAMTDTGNMLKDPISGKPVLIVDSATVCGVLSQRCISHALNGDIAGVMADDPSHRVRLVPAHTASGHSMICAFVPESIRIHIADKKGNKSRSEAFEIDALFAPARLCLSSDKLARGCAALIPADITY